MSEGLRRMTARSADNVGSALLDSELEHPVNQENCIRMIIRMIDGDIGDLWKGVAFL